MTSTRPSHRATPEPKLRTLSTGLCIALAMILAACGSGADSGDAASSVNAPEDDPPLDEPLPDITTASLPPLGEPLTAAPLDDSEPVPSTLTGTANGRFTIVTDPYRVSEPDNPLITEAEFDAGPPDPVITAPPDLDVQLNAPPDFLDLKNQTVEAGAEITVRLITTDPDGDVPGMFPVSLPVGARYEDNFDGTRSLTWRPLQPDVGFVPVTITAVDAAEPLYRTERTFYLKVILPDDPGSIVNLPPTVNEVRRHTVREGDPVSIALRGADPNGTQPELSVLNPPAGATVTSLPLEPGTRLLEFTATQAGELTLSVEARDAIDPMLTGRREIVIDVRAADEFLRDGSRLRTLAEGHDKLVGYAALQGFYFRPDGALYADTAAAEFNVLTTENSLKWSLVNPLPGRYRWASADNLVRFARTADQQVHGHPLVWHRQLPRWVREAPIEQRQQHMREFIARVVERYRNDVTLWDVVNEAIDDAGGYRNSVWLEAMGANYIDIAFQQARQADPNAILLYNDYDLIVNPAKTTTLLGMLENLRNIGTPLDGVGFQMHLTADFGQFERTRLIFERVAALDLDIYITELDVSLTESQSLDDQAAVFAAITRLCLTQPRCKALQTWGFTDMYSWRRTLKPLLLDEAYQPKPAYRALQNALGG